MIYSQKRSPETPIIEVQSTTDFDKAIALCKSEWDSAQLNNPDYTLSYLANASNAEKWAVKKGSLKQVFEAKHALLIYHVNAYHDAEIISRGKELLSYEGFRDDSFSVGVAAALLYAYGRTAQHHERLQLFPLFYELNFKHGNPYHRDENHLHNDLARVYYDLENYSNAKEEYAKYVEGLKPTNDHVSRSSSYNNIGLCHREMGSLDSAKHYFDLALESLIPVKDGTNIWTSEYLAHFANVIRGNIARIYMNDGEYTKARELIEPEIRSGIEQREFHIVSNGYLAIAEILYNQNQMEDALTYLDSAFQNLHVHRSAKSEAKALLLSARCYSALGLKETSDSMFALYNQFTDSVNKAKASQKDANAVVKYNVKNKDKALAQSRAKNEKDLATLRSRTAVLIVTGVILLLVIISYVRNRRAQKIIALQKQQAEKSLHEKEVLLKEIHHRVKNNLQVVSGLLEIQAYKSNNKEFDKAVEDSKSQLQTMALVHQMLYQYEDNSAIEMQKYLSQLCEYLFSNELDSENVKLDLKAHDVKLSLQKAIPLGLIVNELVTNAFKHAFNGKKGAIGLSISENINGTKGYKFSYKDNGQGLPEEIKLDTIQTQGLKLVGMLSEEMHSELKFYNSDGLNVQIEFED